MDVRKYKGEVSADRLETRCPGLALELVVCVRKERAVAKRRDPVSSVIEDILFLRIPVVGILTGSRALAHCPAWPEHREKLVGNLLAHVLDLLDGYDVVFLDDTNENIRGFWTCNLGPAKSLDVECGYADYIVRDRAWREQAQNYDEGTDECFLQGFLPKEITMAHRLTREELHELVWTEPMSRLAKTFGVSDVAVSKACKRASIPRPPRGYWARKRAGKNAPRVELPLRGPGMSHEVRIGASRYDYGYGMSDEEVLSAEPQKPSFDQSIELVAEFCRKLVGRIKSSNLEHPHKLVQQLLDEDHRRREELEGKTYVSFWNRPKFDDAFEQRRLRLLDAVFQALERCGFKPSIRGGDARELSVKVNDTFVSFTLDSETQKGDRSGNMTVESRGSSQRMQFEIRGYDDPDEGRRCWKDEPRKRLEKQLSDIVSSLVLAAECRYRCNREDRYQWIIKRKASIIEAQRKRKEAEAQAERERIAQLEQERIDRLLADANALRIAEEIRAYVSGVRSRLADGKFSVPSEDASAWSEWALAQADRIDPVRNGKLLESVKVE